MEKKKDLNKLSRDFQQYVNMQIIVCRAEMCKYLSIIANDEGFDISDFG